VKPRSQSAPGQTPTGPAPAPKIIKVCNMNAKARCGRMIKARNYRARARVIKQHQRGAE
jgi:hypothetical protein